MTVSDSLEATSGIVQGAAILAGLYLVYRIYQSVSGAEIPDGSDAANAAESHGVPDLATEPLEDPLINTGADWAFAGNPITAGPYWMGQATTNAAEEAIEYRENPDEEDVPFEWNPAHPDWEYTGLL